MCEVFVLKILCFRYPRNAVTDILLSFLCLFIIILIIQNGEQTEVISDSGYKLVIDYLSSYGWEINPDYITESIIILPDKSLPSMKEFYELQHKQGFATENYIGKEIKRFDAEIINYPDENADGIFASVFIYGDKVIAAEIHSVSINGFMHGVDRNEFTKT